MEQLPSSLVVLCPRWRLARAQWHVSWGFHDETWTCIINGRPGIVSKGREGSPPAVVPMGLLCVVAFRMFWSLPVGTRRESCSARSFYLFRSGKTLLRKSLGLHDLRLSFRLPLILAVFWHLGQAVQGVIAARERVGGMCVLEDLAGRCVRFEGVRRRLGGRGRFLSRSIGRDEAQQSLRGYLRVLQ